MKVAILIEGTKEELRGFFKKREKIPTFRLIYLLIFRLCRMKFKKN